MYVYIADELESQRDGMDKPRPTIFNLLDERIDKTIDRVLYWEVYRELYKRQNDRLSAIDLDKLSDLF